MKEPLGYLNRKELQVNILKNIERKIMESTKIEDSDPEGNLDLKWWWNNTVNWVKVQTFLNGNTRKAGSTSSAYQCIFLGIDPYGYSVYDTIQKETPNEQR